MERKEINAGKREANYGNFKKFILIFEMGIILLACAACLVILAAPLSIVIKAAAFGLFAFVVRNLVRHLTTATIFE